MRSAREISFRLSQEAANVWLRFAKPRPGRVDPPSPLPAFPDPRHVADELRNTTFARDVEEIANSILDHKIPLLGLLIDTGADIRWRKDYVNGKETGTQYLRRVPYLDFNKVGDHKVTWELNRHQHLVVLAQAYLLTGRREYITEIERQLDSWFEQNPFQRGINWTSALEVAFRALSWIWLWHLAGRELNETSRAKLLAGLYQHGLHLAHNLSVYFSPNTHLLGEAVALHAIGKLFPQFRKSARWVKMCRRILQQEILRQVRDDGSHFEQSAYYHVYAMDMFTFHMLIESVGDMYKRRLKRMADYLSAVMGPSRILPLIGDDDGGRFFHPYGARDLFGRATLATAASLFCSTVWPWDAEDIPEQCAWWTDKRPPAADPKFKSRLFRDAGVAVFAEGPLEVVVDAGPFGPGSGGHSHSDTLSFVVRWGGEEILIDPGTYVYMGDPQWRNGFRGSAGHNTIRVDEKDQAAPAGPFRWMHKPDVGVVSWSENALEGVCKYRGITHRRTIRIESPGRIVVVDSIEGDGEHLVEQFWHWGDHRNGARLSVEGGQSTEIEGWRSRVLHVKEPASVTRVSYRGRLPVELRAVLELGN